MSSGVLEDLEEAIKMKAFWDERCKWAEETFGGVQERGPLGALRHLAKEVQEAISDLEEKGIFSAEYRKELIDCKFLLEEAMWRSGMTYKQIADVAFEKLEENKKRKWPKPDGDNPVEHVKQ